MKTRQVKKQLSLYQYFTFTVFLILLITSVLLYLGIYFAMTFGIFTRLETGLPFAFGLVLFLSLLLGTGLAFFSRKRILAPLKEIQAATQMIARGNYRIHLRTDRSISELNELNHNMAIMAEELASTELMKKAFLSTVSHELKTPLSIINGYANLILLDQTSREDAQHYAKKIQETSQAFTKITENILLLTSIENSHLPFQRSSYRLDEQLREVLLQLEPMWAKKRIHFELDLPLCYISKNQELLVHVWNNLLLNAIHYAPQNSIVSCKLSYSHQQILVAITNEGPIIPPEELPYIFQAFKRGSRSTGQGLGLAIAQQIIEKSHGQISVTSEETKGTTFLVSFIQTHNKNDRTY